MHFAENNLDDHDCVLDNLLAMPPHLTLAQASYGDDFVRHVVANNVWEYRSPDNGQSFETILIGEILPATCGTRFSAKGSHFVGSTFNPTFIEDKTRVKNVFVLGKPSAGPEGLANFFHNQIVTLCDVIEQDKRDVPGKWTSYATSDTSGLPDYIHIITDPMYTSSLAHGQNKANLKKKPLTGRTPLPHPADGSAGNTSGSQTDNGVDMTDITFTSGDPVASTSGSIVHADSASDKKIEPKNPLTTNTIHAPSMLPDYGGELFKHVHAKLRQLDFRDLDDNLIPPAEWYSQLKQGTLVMVRGSLHAYNWENRRVYNLNAHTVRVLVPSNLPTEERKVTSFDHDNVKNHATSEAANMLSNVVLGKRRRVAD